MKSKWWGIVRCVNDRLAMLERRFHFQSVMLFTTWLPSGYRESGSRITRFVTTPWLVLMCAG
jgi:hypothetical protein